MSRLEAGAPRNGALCINLRQVRDRASLGAQLRGASGQRGQVHTQLLHQSFAAQPQGAALDRGGDAAARQGGDICRRRQGDAFG
jgi:hypothetical protein